MSCPKSDFAEIAQPRRRRDRGIGEHPNKQENVRPRESGSRAIFRKCIYTCIACRFPPRTDHRGMDLIADSHSIGTEPTVAVPIRACQQQDLPIISQSGFVHRLHPPPAPGCYGICRFDVQNLREIGVSGIIRLYVIIDNALMLMPPTYIGNAEHSFFKGIKFHARILIHIFIVR